MGIGFLHKSFALDLTLALTEVSAYGMLVEHQRRLVRCEKLTACKTTISYISWILT